MAAKDVRFGGEARARMLNSMGISSGQFLPITIWMAPVANRRNRVPTRPKVWPVSSPKARPPVP